MGNIRNKTGKVWIQIQEDCLWKAEKMKDVHDDITGANVNGYLQCL